MDFRRPMYGKTKVVVWWSGGGLWSGWVGRDFFEKGTHPKFNSSPLKNGWLEDDPASYWVSVTFQG